MYWRITAALIVAALLAGTHWKVYVTGKQAVQAEWNLDIQKRTEQALAAEQAARDQEQHLVAEKHKAEEAYVNEKRKAARAAAGAKSELDRLRDAIAERGAGETCADPSPQPRADAGARLEQELLGHCAGALTELAAEADRLEALVVGLQGYIKGTVLKQSSPQP
jgi:hypothetical protein